MAEPSMEHIGQWDPELKRLTEAGAPAYMGREGDTKAMRAIRAMLGGLVGSAQDIQKYRAAQKQGFMASVRLNSLKEEQKRAKMALDSSLENEKLTRRALEQKMSIIERARHTLTEAERKGFIGVPEHATDIGRQKGIEHAKLMAAQSKLGRVKAHYAPSMIESDLETAGVGRDYTEQQIAESKARVLRGEEASGRADVLVTEQQANMRLQRVLSTSEEGRAGERHERAGQRHVLDMRALETRIDLAKSQDLRATVMQEFTIRQQTAMQEVALRGEKQKQEHMKKFNKRQLKMLDKKLDAMDRARKTGKLTDSLYREQIRNTVEAFYRADDLHNLAMRTGDAQLEALYKGLAEDELKLAMQVQELGTRKMLSEQQGTAQALQNRRNMFLTQGLMDVYPQASTQQRLGFHGFPIEQSPLSQSLDFDSAYDSAKLLEKQRDPIEREVKAFTKAMKEYIDVTEGKMTSAMDPDTARGKMVSMAVQAGPLMQDYVNVGGRPEVMTTQLQSVNTALDQVLQSDVKGWGNLQDQFNAIAQELFDQFGDTPQFKSAFMGAMPEIVEKYFDTGRGQMFLRGVGNRQLAANAIAGRYMENITNANRR